MIINVANSARSGRHKMSFSELVRIERVTMKANRGIRLMLECTYLIRYQFSTNTRS